jgi:hypothetical protein
MKRQARAVSIEIAVVRILSPLRQMVTISICIGRERLAVHWLPHILALAATDVYPVTGTELAGPT